MIATVYSTILHFLAGVGIAHILTYNLLNKDVFIRCIKRDWVVKRQEAKEKSELEL